MNSAQIVLKSRSCTHKRRIVAVSRNVHSADCPVHHFHLQNAVDASIADTAAPSSPSATSAASNTHLFSDDDETSATSVPDDETVQLFWRNQISADVKHILRVSCLYDQFAVDVAFMLNSRLELMGIASREGEIYGWVNISAYLRTRFYQSLAQTLSHFTNTVFSLRT